MAARRASGGTKYRGTRQSGSYVEGTAARKMAAVPARKRTPGKVTRPDREEPAQARPKRRSSQEIAREHAKRRAIQRNRERAFAMSPGYVFFLTVAITIFGIICGAYLYLQSESTILTGTITSLELEIAELKADNSTTENRIDSQLGVEDVKDAAESLGMSTPDESSILYYDADDSDYMNQVGEVPSE